MKSRFIAVLVLASLFCWSASLSLARVNLDSGAPTSSTEPACCRHSHVISMPQKLFGFAPQGMPCGHEHPCCAHRIPETRSSLPTVNRVPRPNPPSQVKRQRSAIATPILQSHAAHTVSSPMPLEAWSGASEFPGPRPRRHPHPERE